MLNLAPNSRFIRLSFFAPVLLISTAVGLRADAIITTGSVQSSGQQFFNSSIQLQGSNLTISGNQAVPFGLFLLNVPSRNAQTVTFNPTVSATTGTGPLSALSLNYNGTTYNSAQVVLNFVGAAVTVPNTFGFPISGNYQGDVSNVPFTMTGLITIYSAAVGGPVLFTIPISGAGIYSAHVQGNFLAGGPGGVPSGIVNYQFEPSPGAAFTLDSTTQGAWNGKYGGEGYLIANGPSYLPSYAAVGVSRASTYTWTGQTTDPRALQNGAGTASGIASSYYGNNFDVTVNFTDNLPHPIALYLLDFDTTTRAETITITNANTGAVIDTETISNFHNGVYAIWELQGNVRINVSRLNGANAVISGIFFGPTGSTLPSQRPPSAASFSSSDTTTQGSWTGKYGRSGYLIAGGSSTPFTAATVSLAGDFVYTWAGQTSDPRALQTFAGSSNRIASSYTQFPGTGFTIRVSSSPFQRITLYMLDWENAGRMQTVTITDISTNVILDSRTFSGFGGGVYASWLVTGDVAIKVTPVGSSSPVVSGIFLN